MSENGRTQGTGLLLTYSVGKYLMYVNKRVRKNDKYSTAVTRKHVYQQYCLTTPEPVLPPQLHNISLQVTIRLIIS